MCRVGVVGLGGGGSHIVQQLAHLGFQRYVVYDGDHVEESNLNRLVGATVVDARERTPKTEVAQRGVLGLQPGAEIVVRRCRWQDDPHALRGCDLIFGCVDSFDERRQLEVCARRYLIPYIDIGLDVHRVGDEPARMAGQVTLSMPGEPCLACLGFLTEDVLAREAARYGDAGPRPQVVWANGVLASTAVGLAVDLLTDWTGSTRAPVYLTYDANRGTAAVDVRLQYRPRTPCPHFPASQVGAPVLRPM
jgi:threonine dehydrogenase-like Zn-dependent dehydrogenase